jgi:hypothetical protein
MSTPGAIVTVSTRASRVISTMCGSSLTSTASDNLIWSSHPAGYSEFCIAAAGIAEGKRRASASADPASPLVPVSVMSAPRESMLAPALLCLQVEALPERVKLGRHELVARFIPVAVLRGIQEAPGGGFGLHERG